MYIERSIQGVFWSFKMFQKLCFMDTLPRTEEGNVEIKYTTIPKKRKKYLCFTIIFGLKRYLIEEVFFSAVEYFYAVS